MEVQEIPHAREVLDALRELGTASVNKIAKKTGLAWQTVKITLLILAALGRVRLQRKVSEVGTVYWVATLADDESDGELPDGAGLPDFALSEKGLAARLAGSPG